MTDVNDDSELLEYNLDQYDEEDEEEGQPYYTSNEEDPYITLNDEDDETDDFRILATDSVLVAAKTEDEVSQLEIYVYEESEDNLYVHNDIIGNYVAIGTFEPEIEIWDLDVSNSMYPDAILGRPNKELKKKKKKVQQVEWHSIEPTIMLTASFDKTVVVFDSRTPKNVASWSLGDADPECVRWDPFTPQYFYGKVFAAQFCLDLPFHLAVAGSGGKVHIWDLSTNAGIRNSFKETINEESENDDDEEEIDLEEIENDSGDD
ncbi:4034_t:CDS:2, partial [Racocetra fulgida]